MAHATRVDLSEPQRAVPDVWTRNKAGTCYRLIERARIVLMSADGLSAAEQARRLDVDRRGICRWRTRWKDNHERLTSAEQTGASARDLSALIEAVLADEKRPGAPATFTAEQLVQIIAVACEPPGDSGRPVTQCQAAKRVGPCDPDPARFRQDFAQRRQVGEGLPLRPVRHGSPFARERSERRRVL